MLDTRSTSPRSHLLETVLGAFLCLMGTHLDIVERAQIQLVNYIFRMHLLASHFSHLYAINFVTLSFNWYSVV